MAYKIKISYTTGDSINSNREEDFLELTWESLDIAKQNLLAIKEHYEMFNKIYEFRYKNQNKYVIFDKHKDKSWFVNVPKLFNKLNGCAIDEKYKSKIGEENCEYKPTCHIAEHCLNLITDNGTKMQISCFWIGTFEALHEIEIVIDNSDMKYEFY